MRVLAIDPSGNFNEGKGTTGWCMITDLKEIIYTGQIKAENYDTVYDYTLAHIRIIEELKPDIVVLEDFKLYADKAMNQINSRFETPKLIGVLEFICSKHMIPTYLQSASEVKNRWKDDILVYNNYITKLNNRYYINSKLISEHIRDSIRHGVHFVTFKLNKLGVNKWKN